jgi:hypothetical protein
MTEDEWHDYSPFPTVGNDSLQGDVDAHSTPGQAAEALALEIYVYLEMQ